MFIFLNLLSFPILINMCERTFTRAWASLLLAIVLPFYICTRRTTFTRYTIYSIHYTLYSIHSALHIVYCTRECIVFSVYCIVYTVYCIVYCV